MMFVVVVGFVGAGIGIALAILWASVAALFSLSYPSPEQIGGLVGIGAVMTPALTGGILFWLEEI
jgi:hypothetical protein